MKSWESIVVGIDFSEVSKAALREAARLAHWQQCPLHIAHTIWLDKSHDQPPETSTAISIVRDRVGEHLKTFCLQEVEFLTRGIEYHVLIGHPFRELSQLCHDISASLLVLGSCNREPPPTHPGPIATNCVRKAPVPVVLVRSTHDKPYRSIVAALDFSKTSLEVAQISAEIAFENQSHLHLVHVHEPILRLGDYTFRDLPPPPHTDANDPELKKLRAQLEQCKSDLLSRFQDLSVTTHLLQDKGVNEALVAFIRDHQVDLAALGTRGRSGMRSLLLGTTAERLLHECPCSLLTIKPRDFKYSL